MSPVTILLATGSAPVTQWGPRLLLTAVVLVVVGLGLWGMRHGWRARAARQADLPELPELPVGPVVGPAVRGLYVATTTEGDLLDRIVVHGLGARGRAELVAVDAGVLIRRAGEPSVWIPRDAVVAVRLGSGQAQRAFERGGLILIAWRLGDRVVETGFRADDPAAHVQAAQQLAMLAPSAGGAR